MDNLLKLAGSSGLGRSLRILRRKFNQFLAESGTTQRLPKNLGFGGGNSLKGWQEYGALPIERQLELLPLKPKLRNNPLVMKGIEAAVPSWAKGTADDLSRQDINRFTRNLVEHMGAKGKGLLGEMQEMIYPRGLLTNYYTPSNSVSYIRNPKVLPPNSYRMRALQDPVQHVGHEFSHAVFNRLYPADKAEQLREFLNIVRPMRQKYYNLHPKAYQDSLRYQLAINKGPVSPPIKGNEIMPDAIGIEFGRWLKARDSKLYADINRRLFSRTSDRLVNKFNARNPESIDTKKALESSRAIANAIGPRAERGAAALDRLFAKIDPQMAKLRRAVAME